MTRSPIALTLVLLALAPAAGPAWQAPAGPPAALSQAEPPAIIHGPLLLNPAPDRMTVVWFTDKPCTSWVEYATGGNFRTFPRFGGLIQTARMSRHGLIDADTVRHEVRLAGLEPGKAYRYRVVSKSILAFQPYEVVYGPVTMSEIREFRTLDVKKAELRFVVFQDTHSDAAKMAALAAKADPASADLVFLNGDNINDADKEEVVLTGTFGPAARLFGGTAPVVFIRGNHETRGGMARGLEAFFPPPRAAIITPSATAPSGSSSSTPARTSPTTRPSTRAWPTSIVTGPSRPPGSRRRSQARLS